MAEWRGIVVGCLLAAACDGTHDRPGGEPAEAGQLSNDRAQDAAPEPVDAAQSDDTEATPDASPDADNPNDTLPLGPADVGGKSFADWLSEVCPHFPTPTGPVPDSGFPSCGSVPFSSLSDALTMNCTLTPGDSSNDADADGVRLSAFVDSRGVRCHLSAEVSCPGSCSWTWHYSGDAESGNINAYCGKSCMQSFAGPPMDLPPIDVQAALTTPCVTDMDWAVPTPFRVDSERGARCPEAPPFTTLEEALASGCTRVPARPVELDLDGDGRFLIATVSEGRIDCNVREALECGDGTWSLERRTQQAVETPSVQDARASLRTVVWKHAGCIFTATDPEPR